MPRLHYLLAALCGCHGSSPPDAALDAAASDRYEIRGSCAHPLDSDGALAFLDAAAMAQTSYRAIDVVNVGERIIMGRELMHWEVEGPDAAEFTVASGLVLSLGGDGESCRYHDMLGTQFPVGSSCRVDVTFHPTTVGVKRATLHVTHPPYAIDQRISIHGTAVAAPTGLYASASDLYIKPPTISESQGFMIVNRGATSIDLGDPVVSGPFALAPQPGWNCPSPLTPGGACSVGSLSFTSVSRSGCPTGAFTTTTSALVVPLDTRFVPSSLAITPPVFGSVRIEPLGKLCTSQGVDCRFTLEPPTDVTLTAVPDPGAHFTGWYAPYGAAAMCGTSPTCVLTAGFIVGLEARFASPQAKSIAVAIAGTGTVSGSSGSCSSSCTLYVPSNTQEVLTETTSGSFIGWGGDCTGAGSTCNLGTVINDRAVSATFSP